MILFSRSVISAADNNLLTTYQFLKKHDSHECSQKFSTIKQQISSLIWYIKKCFFLHFDFPKGKQKKEQHAFSLWGSSCSIHFICWKSIEHILLLLLANGLWTFQPYLLSGNINQRVRKEILTQHNGRVLTWMNFMIHSNKGFP
jgi:hypothetical protein